MTMRQIKSLHSGDEVFWTDPDGGACSRSLTIETITIVERVVVIWDDEGDTLECFANELS